MGIIRGHTITLLQKIQTGVDPANQPTYEIQRVDVDNVLVEPVSADDIVDDLNLYGKQATYKIHIPKGDTHVWDGQQVEFLGHTWDVYTFPIEYYPEDTPLDWDRQYYCERYK